MKRIFLGLLVPIALAACGTTTATNSGAGSSPSAAASGSSSGATVKVASGSLGQFIVDGNGKTLYLFEADKSTASTCSAACAQAWPPLTTTGSPQASSGAQASLLGTTSRADGTTQVTYAGHPLYFFIGDKQAGDTKGEGIVGFGAGWDMVHPDGSKIEKPGS